jgi:hypothetical protein
MEELDMKNLVRKPVDHSFEIDRDASLLIKECNSLNEVYVLKSKLTRLPQDLSSVKKLQDKIDAYLLSGSLDQKINELAQNSLCTKVDKICIDLDTFGDRWLLEMRDHVSQWQLSKSKDLDFLTDCLCDERSKIKKLIESLKTNVLNRPTPKRPSLI